MKTILRLATLLLLLPTVPSLAAPPPPRTIQVYGDTNLQTAELPIDLYGGALQIWRYYVYAYDLPESTSAVRFHLEVGNPSVNLSVMAADGWVLTNENGNVLLEAEDGCFPGAGKVRLATGGLLTTSGPYFDVEVCMGEIVDPQLEGPGLAVRACGDTEWQPLQLHYEGCAVASPWNLGVPTIENNDPNALEFRTSGDVVGQPTQLATTRLTVRAQLLKAGEPLELRRIAVRWTWDPAVAAFSSVDRGLVPAEWEENLDVGPGAVTATYQGASDLPLNFFTSTVATLQLQMGDYRGESPLGVEVLELVDGAGEAIDFSPPADAQVRATCPGGDLDADNLVTALDALQALRYAVGLDAFDLLQLCRADANENREVDAGDAALILRQAVGGVPFPWERVAPSGDAVPLTATVEGGRVTFHASFAAALQIELAPLPSSVALEGSSPEPGTLVARNFDRDGTRVAMARGEDGALNCSLTFTGSDGEVLVTRVMAWNADGVVVGEVHDLSLPLDLVPTPTPSSRTETGLLPCAPNPFNPRTEIRFQMEEDGAVRFDIFDARGRRVLTRRTWAARGPGFWVWDGRDEEGRSVASGVYQVRMQAMGRSFRESVGLVR